MGAPTLVECGIVLSARIGKDGRAMLSRFLEELEIITIPFTETHYRTAVGAWIKYGKGRNTASLNFGDCLTYATAKLSNMPLVCVGDDFTQTDLALA
jgi:ribonuclease VapC